MSYFCVPQIKLESFVNFWMTATPFSLTPFSTSFPTSSTNSHHQLEQIKLLALPFLYTVK